MEAWAHCSECSQDYPHRFDLRIDVNPRDTHTAIRRKCPDCGEVTRISVGHPVIEGKESGVVSEAELGIADSVWAKKLFDEETLVDVEPRHDWYVYVLECEWRQVGNREYEPWKFAAMKAMRRVYVGSTNDLEFRMLEHGDPYSSSRLPIPTEFTHFFPPKRLLEIHSRASEPQAREYEKRRAIELEAKHPGWFVWQN
jgi:predicted GIY-YIG superfamily endonuclease